MTPDERALLTRFLTDLAQVPVGPKDPEAAALIAQATAAQMVASRLGSTGATALNLALKSQRRAGDAAPEVPGASIEANFKRLARDRHPDRGGSDAAMAELNAARERALKERAS